MKSLMLLFWTQCSRPIYFRPQWQLIITKHAIWMLPRLVKASRLHNVSIYLCSPRSRPIHTVGYYRLWAMTRQCGKVTASLEKSNGNLCCWIYHYFKFNVCGILRHTEAQRNATDRVLTNLDTEFPDRNSVRIRLIRGTRDVCQP